ncbi:MAG TPA: hypothetical protein VMW65_01265, partial [Chloroflexota bacterium]|nr:hypothetical protein [Chloroflexota bacterium]
MLKFTRLIVLGSCILLVGYSTTLAFAGPGTSSTNSVVGTGLATLVNIGAPRFVHVTYTSDPPALSTNEQKQLETLSRRPQPGGPSVPTIGAVGLTRNRPNMSQVSTGSNRIAAAATPTLTFHQVTDLSGSVGTSQAYFAEPSASNDGNAAWETGNWFDALSTDGGQNFSYASPFNAFSTANTWGGFCCDQHTIYDPSRDLTFWLLQYQPDAQSNNGLRLAVAKGQAGLAAGNWYYFDLTPQQFGIASGHLFDYPQLALGSNDLYLTSNVYTTNYNSSNFYRSLILRIPLDQLASPGSSLSIAAFS